ncbi:hypothetical protein BDI4_470012 [Burkholderia diffusa]|nr:hypothetical protein BDI4_470012 [Burkholderia diffusa]
MDVLARHQRPEPFRLGSDPGDLSAARLDARRRRVGAGRRSFHGRLDLPLPRFIPSHASPRPPANAVSTASRRAAPARDLPPHRPARFPEIPPFPGFARPIGV